MMKRMMQHMGTNNCLKKLREKESKMIQNAMRWHTETQSLLILLLICLKSNIPKLTHQIWIVV